MLVPYKVVLNNQAQDFIGLNSLQHLAINTQGLDFWSLSQEAHQQLFFTLTCIEFHPIIIGPYCSTFEVRLNVGTASLDRASATDMSSTSFQLSTFCLSTFSFIMTKQKYNVVQYYGI